MPKAITFIILLVTSMSCFAIDYEVHLKGGTRLTGDYRGDAQANIYFATSDYPLVLIPKASIKKVYYGRDNITQAIVSGDYKTLSLTAPVLALPDSLPRQALAPNPSALQPSYIKSSLDRISIPLWIMAITSVITTVHLLK